MLFSPIEVLEGCIEERERHAENCDRRIQEHNTAILNIEREKANSLAGLEVYREAIRRLSDTK
jgi:hypothetical protein